MAGGRPTSTHGGVPGLAMPESTSITASRCPEWSARGPYEQREDVDERSTGVVTGSPVTGCRFGEARGHSGTGTGTHDLRRPCEHGGTEFVQGAAGTAKWQFVGRWMESRKAAIGRADNFGSSAG